MSSLAPPPVSAARVPVFESRDAPAAFDALGLPPALLRAVSALGFHQPTAIQAAAIPALLAGRDVTGVAQTGTGKTAAFGLPLLASLDPSDRRVQALVLTPTRELALQVAGAIAEFAAGMPGVRVATVYGGASMSGQLSALRRGAQIVVGTPGRIIDHLHRGSLRLDGVRFVVLDEADEMLRMGFADDTDRILGATPRDRQTALFSATMPRAIRAVAERHLHEPVDASVATSATPVPAIRQRYAVLPFRQKVDALVAFLAVRPDDRAADAAVVFVRTRSACEEVGAQLAERGVSVAAISGDVTQRERERTIARLRNRQVDVLVATDVAARGLDVERIGLVVNFDAPSDPETYVHRIGRTGRAGRAGEALLFLAPRELGKLRAIERATGQRLEQVAPPTATEVTTHRAASRLREALVRQRAGRLDTCRAALQSAARESGVDVTELAAALLAVTAGDDGAAPVVPGGATDRTETRYRTDHATRTAERGRSGRPARTERRERAEHGDRWRRAEHGHRRDRLEHGAHRPDARAQHDGVTAATRRGSDSVRYVVQVGRRHGARPAGIVGAITGEGGLSGADLGRIDIFDEHSVVEIARPVGAAALARIRRATVSGQQLRIRQDRPSGRARFAAGPAARSGTGRRRDQNRVA